MSIKTIAIAIDVSKSMNEKTVYGHKKFDVAKTIFEKLTEKLFNILNIYRLHLYVFPSEIPDVIPCEKILYTMVLDKYYLEKVKRLLDHLTIRPSTPLIETIIRIAEEIENNSTIVVITDGILTTPINREKISKLEKTLKNKHINVFIINLGSYSKELEQLVQIGTVIIETIYGSSLHPLLIDRPVEIIAYRLTQRRT